jgi:hypothetical protein
MVAQDLVQYYSAVNLTSSDVATLLNNDGSSRFSTILQCKVNPHQYPVVLSPHCLIVMVAQDLVQYYSVVNPHQ